MIIREDQIYERYAPRLLAVCQRYTGDRDAAEDVLHDAFMSIFKSLGRFDFRGENALYAWMRKIAVNKSLDWLRRRARDPIPLEDERMPEYADDSGPEASDVRKIPLEALTKMISELPEGYRTIFNLFCIEGWSHAKIAKELGIKENSSSSQYNRARAQLAKKIKEYLNEQDK